MSADVLLAAHATFVIVTLEHDRLGHGASSTADPLLPDWKPWWSRLDADGIERAKSDAGFFLEYVRGVVAPEVAPTPGPNQGALHLTLARERLAPIGNLELVTRHGAERPPTGLRLVSVDLILYPTGVGFLVLKVELAGEPTLGALIEANGHLRTLRAPSTTWALAVLRAKGAGAATEQTMAELLESLAKGVGRLALSGEPRAQLVCFACAEVPASGERGAFPSPHDRLLYELTTCVGLDRTLTDPTWAPGADQVDVMMKSLRYAPWRAWRALCLKEMFGVLATEVVGFTTGALPRVLEGVYLPLYLYALHQRAMLGRFSRELVARVASGRLGVHEVRRHVDAYQDFRHRYWLSEVTGRPMGGELYRKLQDGLELGALHGLAAQATQEVRAFHEERRSRRLSLLLGVLTFAFGPFGTAVQIANFAVPDASNGHNRARVTALALVAIWALLGVLWLRTRPRR